MVFVYWSVKFSCFLLALKITYNFTNLCIFNNALSNSKLWEVRQDLSWIQVKTHCAQYRCGLNLHIKYLLSDPGMLLSLQPDTGRGGRVIVCVAWLTFQRGQWSWSTIWGQKEEALSHSHLCVRTLTHKWDVFHIPGLFVSLFWLREKRKWMLAGSVNVDRPLDDVVLPYSSWRWWVWTRDVSLFCF